VPEPNSKRIFPLEHKMKIFVKSLLVVSAVPLLLFSSVLAADSQTRDHNHQINAASGRNDAAASRDIAFISVWGSRPKSEMLQGFQRAVLFNARGEVVKKLDMGRDSIFSLDRMIQENRTKGPLFIRMYRR
jgi:hypothetical protein